jgi:hypothetical protein
MNTASSPSSLFGPNHTVPNRLTRFQGRRYSSEMHAHSFTDYIDGKVQPNKERSDCNRMLAQGRFLRPLLRPGNNLIKDVIMPVDRLKSGTRIWIAAGFTDLRRGFKGLSSIVETVPEQTPSGLSGETMSGGGFQRVGKPAAPCEFRLGDGGQVGLLPGDQAG